MEVGATLRACGVTWIVADHVAPGHAAVPTAHAEGRVDCGDVVERAARGWQVLRVHLTAAQDAEGVNHVRTRDGPIGSDQRQQAWQDRIDDGRIDRVAALGDDGRWNDEENLRANRADALDQSLAVGPERACVRVGGFVAALVPQLEFGIIGAEHDDHGVPAMRSQLFELYRVPIARETTTVRRRPQDTQVGHMKLVAEQALEDCGVVIGGRLAEAAVAVRVAVPDARNAADHKKLVCTPRRIKRTAPTAQHLLSLRRSRHSLLL